MTSKYGFSVVAPISVTQAVLDRVQDRVLLRLVEAVDLVDEEDRPPARTAEALLGAPEHRRTSSTRAETAESSSNAAPVCSATIRASVVLPAARAGRRGSARARGPARSPAVALTPLRGRAPGRRARRARPVGRGTRAAPSRPAAPARRRQRGRSWRGVCSRRHGRARRGKPGRGLLASRSSRVQLRSRLRAVPEHRGAARAAEGPGRVGPS